jgi:catechol 2,3-dioxygenase-like lactoylglutathione lyase family enzyme
MTDASGQFSFTKIIVSDVDRVFPFYRDVLGLAEVARVRIGEGEHELDEIIMGAAGGGYRVPSLVIQRFPNRPLPAPGEATLGFIVPDVDRAVEAAEAAGGALVRPARTVADHGVRVAFVTDNDGHLLELVQTLQDRQQPSRREEQEGNGK